MSGITKKRGVSVKIEDDNEEFVIVTVRHGYKPKDYIKIHEETRIYLERDHKASLLTHLIDVAFKQKKWAG